MSDGGALIVTLALLLIGVAAVRSRRDLQAWLGSDPLGTRRILRAALLGTAVLATAIAFARSASTPPRLGGASADVVLVVDVSRSMDARDTAPSRLRRALDLAERFAVGTGGARLGLVAFSGAAFPVLPLTQDRDALAAYLRGLDSEIISRPGSDLAAALRAAARVFDPTSSRPREVLLFTDGEQLAGDLDGALDALVRLGVRVTAVGMGTTRGSVVPIAGGRPLRDRDGRTVRSRRDDGTLERVTEATGGAYYREPEDRPEPASLAPSPSPRVPVEDATERAAESPWAALAALTLAVEILLSSPTRRRRRWRRKPGLAPLAAASLLILGAGPRSWLEEGDRKLAEGRTQEALGLYRRTERTVGRSAATLVRVGNALYRMGRPGLASGSYLSALQATAPDEEDLRFLAAFNLGSALLYQERYREARDALWTALMTRPDDVEAKFNYEWAVERIPPEEDPVGGPTEGGPGEPPAGDADPVPTPRRGGSDREAAPAPPPSLTDPVAERWLRSIEEDPAGPLRDQIAEQLGTPRRGPGGGPDW